MSSVAIEAKNVAIHYRTGEFVLKVLDGADLCVNEGEFLSVQGESGCGKTTLLNILAGIETPDSGYVKWQGEPIQNLKRDALARKRGGKIGIVFQSYYLIPEIDALQNVLMSQRILSGGIGAKEVEAAKDMLRRVGLGDRFGQMPNTLSGGERQRVAIARALLTNPAVVLADEPTGNLDEKTGNLIMDLLQQLCAEFRTSLVLVTHNKEHAVRADRQLLLSQGKLTPIERNLDDE